MRTIRTGVCGLLLAVMMLVMGVAVQTSDAGAAQASANPHIPAGTASYSRHVCALVAGQARCSAEVRTDQNGIPLVFKAPTVDPTAVSGTWDSYGITPQGFHTAYKLPWNSPVRQTIAIVDGYNHPNVKPDLDYFDSAFKLGAFPNCSATRTTTCFQRVDENGNAKGFTNGNASEAAAWNLETNLDAQTAHSICLNCKLLLVEAYSDSPADLATAVNTAARLGATEISNSYAWAESGLATWYPQAYNHPGVAITASSSDYGYGPYYPADLNTVVAVGGTRLNLAANGAYKSESAWGNGRSSPSGSGAGSGCSIFNSTYTTAAYWQKAVANWAYTGCGTRRSISDVSADADPATGAWVYNSVPNAHSQTGWFSVGGTSLSSPLIAGTYALAGNAASRTWPALSLYQHPGKLHDVKSGANGACTYTIMCTGWAGYDGPTGLGTPAGLGAF